MAQVIYTVETDRGRTHFAREGDAEKFAALHSGSRTYPDFVYHSLGDQAIYSKSILRSRALAALTDEEKAALEIPEKYWKGQS